jgi:membrane protein YdbS with pleckstrin-like domain
MTNASDTDTDGAERSPDADGTAPPRRADGGTSTPEGDAEIPEWLSLDEDEHVEWLGKPVLLSVVSTVAVGVVLIPFFGVGFLVLLAAPFSYLSIENTDYVVTNKSLYVKKGVLSTNIENVGLDKIQNTEYNQSFFGKQLGYGDIDISTAGSSGAEITFQAIEGARDVRERITRLANEYQGRSAGDTGAGEAAPDRAAVGDQLDAILTELQATRETMENVERLLREQDVAGASPGAGPSANSAATSDDAPPEGDDPTGDAPGDTPGELDEGPAE